MKLVFTFTGLEDMEGEIGKGSIISGDSQLEIYKKFVVEEGLYPEDDDELEEGDKPLNDLTVSDLHKMFGEFVTMYGISIVSIFDVDELEFVYLMGQE